ncbi:coproporphyrinogen III oxidase [Sulfurimonas sp.]
MILYAQSHQAKEANMLVTYLQAYFVEKLNLFSRDFGDNTPFEALQWLRDEGLHGGGVRYEARDETLFNRASVNISQVHYDDDITKKLAHATAISTIIHPKNPNVPSMHMHISWTQMRDGSGYFRIMGDLNPSIINKEYKERFDRMFKSAAHTHYEEGTLQGDKYFNIPALKRTRGVSHFYLENYNSGDFISDYNFAKSMGEAIIDEYIAIIRDAEKTYTSYSQEDLQEQLAYHTLYLFQVLTLDRGTTSGLLVHNQNDVGIMGSIPSHINRELLQSWIELVPAPQDKLVKALLEALPKINPTPVDTNTKIKLANAVRKHYTQYPEALKMQASGEIVPPTVNNHS